MGKLQRMKEKYKVWRMGLSLFMGLTLLASIVGCSPAKETLQEVEDVQVQVQVTDAPTATPTEDQSVTNEVIVTPISESAIHFIDTGNSDAILIMNDGKAMLVDGGDNDDESLVVNYLKKQGITDLEYVIATHPHADHVGGLDAVVKSFNVSYVFIANGDAETKTYRDFVQAAIDKGLSPSVPLENKKFPLGNSYFTVLNTNGGSNTNDESLVINYVNGEDHILLMGDAEEEVEEEILSQVTHVDLLKVGHHGSRSSTTQAFLDKVNPTYGVITCGAGNSYGHPHKETMDKLAGIEIHRSDECGDIIFTSTGAGLTTACEAGSYAPGTRESGSSNEKIEPVATAKPVETKAPVESKPVESTKEVVYWTPNGKSYHTTKDCSTLSRSKTILSGSISESGKYDPCDRCH